MAAAQPSFVALRDSRTGMIVPLWEQDITVDLKARKCPFKVVFRSPESGKVLQYIRDNQERKQ